MVLTMDDMEFFFHLSYSTYLREASGIANVLCCSE